MDKLTYRLVHSQARQLAQEAIKTAPDGWMVTISPPKRNEEQSALFHSLCSDIAKSGHIWAGKARTPNEWKCLLVSGHSVATGEGHEIVPGIEAEWINIRESTALMSKKRGASLITYVIAWCDTNGIKIRG